MLFPTKVNICIFGARDLRLKGINGTNNAFVRVKISGVPRPRYYFETLVIKRADSQVRWMTKGDLPLPKNKSSGTAQLTFTVYHESPFLIKRFLGTISLPIKDFDTTEPVRKWYKLQCKPSQGKTDYRGELEIETTLVLQKNV